jgi:hypothetical protein
VIAVAEQVITLSPRTGDGAIYAAYLPRSPYTAKPLNLSPPHAYTDDER